MILNKHNEHNKYGKHIDFIGIGAPKCGSTWTAQCLKETPGILFSNNRNWKEIAYFNKKLLAQDFLDIKSIEHNYRYKKPISWYLKQFPNGGNGSLVGEISPEYLFDEESPYKIKNFFPNVKIIVNLRNPVDFLYSLYWEQQTSVYAYKSISFKELLLCESNYKKIGLYYHYLKRYYDSFPKENIHVILFDDIVNNPELTIQQLYDFLRIKEGFIPQTSKQKIVPTRVPKSKVVHSTASKLSRLIQKMIPMSAERYHELVDILLISRAYDKINRRDRQDRDKYPPMQSDEISYLRNYYKKDIQELEHLIQRDLSGWYKV